MKSIVAAVVAALTISISGVTAAEPRPSWNNGNAKAAITNFVEQVSRVQIALNVRDAGRSTQPR